MKHDDDEPTGKQAKIFWINRILNWGKKPAEAEIEREEDGTGNKKRNILT